MKWFITLYGYYIWNTLVAIDQLCAVIYWGADPDETISSITAKRQDKPFYKLLGKLLEIVDPGHLERFVEHDEGEHSIWNRIK